MSNKFLSTGGADSSVDATDSTVVSNDDHNTEVNNRARGRVQSSKSDWSRSRILVVLVKLKEMKTVRRSVSTKMSRNSMIVFQV